MTVGELKAFIADLPDDMLVITGVGNHHFCHISRCGTVTVIPSHTNKNLLPGNEWRLPTGSTDDPDTPRERHLYIG